MIIVFSALLLFSLAFAQGALAASPESDFNFNPATGTITGYVGPGGDVDIPSTIGGITVAAVGDHAFDALIYPNCYDITSVIIPDTVTTIGNYAFFHCEVMTSITIPDSVTSIGSAAFYYCYMLESIMIPDSVTSIGTYAFCRCHSLESITIPNSLTSISNGTFDYCNSLISITIPDSVTSIGSAAFYYCHSLENITIPDSVTSIGAWVFGNCYSLTSITIPDSVTSIGECAFAECYALTSISMPNNLTSIEDFTFLFCYSLDSFTIPDSVTSIGAYAFYNCESLTSITIPESVTSIEYMAFYDCYSLVSAYFEGDAPYWGGEVFEGAAPGFTIYFYSGHTGFTTPTFQGYPCVELFSVNIGSLSGGSISADTAYAAEGTTVNLTVTPNQGMQLKPGSLKYTDISGEHAISGTSFVMPASDVTITAEFEAGATLYVCLFMLLVCLLVLGAVEVLYEKK